MGQRTEIVSTTSGSRGVIATVKASDLPPTPGVISVTSSYPIDVSRYMANPPLHRPQFRPLPKRGT